MFVTHIVQSRPLAALAAQIGEARLPPVHNWNPPHCGDSEMRIGADGTWYHQGLPIRRPEMVRLFSGILRREADGRHVLVTPVEMLDIEVDDAPFVAVGVESEGRGKGRRLGFRLNTGEAVIAGPDHPIRVACGTTGPRPYLHVRAGLEALVGRSPYHELAEWALAEGNELPGLWSDGVLLQSGRSGLSLIDEIRHVLAIAHPAPAELLSGDVVDDASDEGHIVAAAVLMAIVDRPRPTLLLTKRTDTLRRHPGQVAFPGGRIDAEDDGVVSAALREAWEEVGLPPDKVDVIGMFEPYLTITGFHVTPVVAVIPPDLVLVPHAAEVASVFEAPLDIMLEPANHIEQAVEWQGHDRHYYEIDWDGERVWGATAGMIVNLGRRLAYYR